LLKGALQNPCDFNIATSRILQGLVASSFANESLRSVWEHPINLDHDEIKLALPERQTVSPARGPIKSRVMRSVPAQWTSHPIGLIPIGAGWCKVTRA
jgi:hypothetical protein